MCKCRSKIKPIMKTKSCECCGNQLQLSEFSKSYKNRCKKCVADMVRNKRMSSKTKELSPTILIAESIAALIDCMGMYACNQECIQNDRTPAYSVEDFSWYAKEIRDKIESFK